jgi:hypothetical protein
VSNAGLKVPVVYFITIGLIVFSAKKAPFLNLIIYVPFVVPPSAKIKNGANFPVSSISSCLSLMAARALALDSSLPPLGIYIESIESIKVEKIGTFLNSELGEKAGLMFFIKITVSSQLVWLQTIVEVRLIFF